MRYSWRQIQQMYPDQWVLMKGTHYYSDGDIESAEKVIPYENCHDIDDFGNNSTVCCYYTGILHNADLIDFCGYEEPLRYDPSDDEEMEVELAEEFDNVF